MKKFLLAVSFAALAATPALASEFVILNGSETAIHHAYVSPASQNTWGEDQLGDEAVLPDAEFTVTGIPAGVYDIKLVDEDGTECIWAGVDMSEGAVATVTEDLLDVCAGFGE